MEIEDFPMGEQVTKADFHEVNFSKVAESLGGVGIRVGRPDDIGPALEKALASNSPAVVEVISDVDAMSKRAWRPSVT